MIWVQIVRYCMYIRILTVLSTSFRKPLFCLAFYIEEEEEEEEEEEGEKKNSKLLP